MLFINEWLPNPAGVDTKNEFIELFNNGSVPVNLNGWMLKTTGKKAFSLSGRTIAPKGYLLLNRTATKLSLKNTGETVSLYDAAKHIVDQSAYLGTAPSGQSFSRIYYPETGDRAAQPQSFVWSESTPGVANKANLHNSISANNYPFGMVLNQASSGAAESVGIAIGLAAIIAALVVYSLKSHENLSKLFFPRDGAMWNRIR